MSGEISATIERLSPQQIEERLARASVAYLPLGSLESNHEPQLVATSSPKRAVENYAADTGLQKRTPNRRYRS